MNAPFTIDDAYLAAQELMQGDKEPSLKLALWFSALSTMQRLHRNCRVAAILREYRDTPLPTSKDALYKMLESAGAIVFSRHLDTLYYIQYLEQTGQLDRFHTVGESYASQVEWRDNMHKLVTGKGLSWKTISFALLIFIPTTCELVPVDRHVMMRLDQGTFDSPSKREAYIRIETMVLKERNEMGHSDVPLAVWHWYMWELYRQFVAKSSKAESGCLESHKDLSCRL